LNGTDWIPRFFDRLNKKRPSTRVFHLGARPEVMQNMASVFRRHSLTF
jgi:UDP-N-acetyl-D-mannosaminuronic acid transferase (WecB/TagA/CpsF family)